MAWVRAERNHTSASRFFNKVKVAHVVEEADGKQRDYTPGGTSHLQAQARLRTRHPPVRGPNAQLVSRHGYPKFPSTRRGTRRRPDSGPTWKPTSHREPRQKFCRISEGPNNYRYSERHAATTYTFTAVLTENTTAPDRTAKTERTRRRKWTLAPPRRRMSTSTVRKKEKTPSAPYRLPS